MSRLQNLPAEIRLRIYKLVFQGTLVYPSPIMWAKQPPCDDKAEFERAQADSPDPVGLLTTSKFFNTDPLAVRSFYTNATFCVGQQWQLLALISYVTQEGKNGINPVRLITSIMDTTFDFRLRSQFDLDQISVQIFPNLKHAHLRHLSTMSNCMERVITKVYAYDSHEQRSCDQCTSDFRELSRERYRGNKYCTYHRSPDPARFAIQHPDTTVARRTRQIKDLFCSPNEFILDSFFNASCPKHGPDNSYQRECKCTNVQRLKERIMEDTLTVDLFWRMFFSRDDYGEEKIVVEVSFSSFDWQLRYEWKGKSYQVPQTRPQLFDLQTCRFLP